MDCINEVTALPDGRFRHYCPACREEDILPTAKQHARMCSVTTPPEPPALSEEVERRAEICRACSHWVATAATPTCDACKPCEQNTAYLSAMWGLKNGRCSGVRFGWDDKWKVQGESLSSEA